MRIADLANPSLSFIGFSVPFFFLGLFFLIVLRKSKTVRFAYRMMLVLFSIILPTFVASLLAPPLPRVILFTSFCIECFLFAIALVFTLLFYKEVVTVGERPLDTMNAFLANRKLPKEIGLAIFFFLLLFGLSLLISPFQDISSDIPDAMRSQYSTAKGQYNLLIDNEVSIIDRNAAGSGLYRFEITANFFKMPEENEIVTVSYLPTCNYIVDIKDASGKSLLK